MNIAQTARVRIQRAEPKDAPAIAELAGVIWRAHYPGIITSEQIEYMLARMYALETLRDEIGSRSVCYELLLVEQKLSGFAAFGPAREPSVIKLHKLYLLPDLHGRGLGGMLLRHCETEASRQGARRLLLTVNKQNARAIAAYKRNGFVIIESVVTDIGGGFVMDDFIMVKELDSRPR